MSFQYSPLDKSARQIRLLRVLPRDPDPLQVDALVDCSLIIVSLDDNPSYVALSYVWGDESNRRPVLVDGSETSITKNLQEALHHFQQELESVTSDSSDSDTDSNFVLVWADALCINQDDNAEKSDQIQLMRDIYETASEVLIWLGPSDVASDEVMGFFGRHRWSGIADWHFRSQQFEIE